MHWQNDDLTDRLAAVRHDQGRLIARMENLGLSLQQEAVVETLTEEVVTSSGIEGEMLDRNKSALRSPVISAWTLVVWHPRTAASKASSS